MIDRGALIVRRGGDGYRGAWRPSLDAHPLAASAGMRAVATEYREAIIDGDGVLEDLDLAQDLLRRARALGADDLELVVFEVPQAAPQTSLPLATEPPAEGLALAGWDVIELIEPFCSALRDAREPLARNEFGLMSHRREAEALAHERNEGGAEDELHAARIWLAAEQG